MNDSILYSAVCEEPEGTVTRNVRRFIFTPENLLALWERQRQFKTLMGREIYSFDEFVDFFIRVLPNGAIEPRGICHVIDDGVGIFWLSDITYPAYAEVHYTFFDRRHKGRVNLVREAIKYIFDATDIGCLYVRVGLYAKSPMKFVEQIGFKKEGRLRKRMYYQGSWYDANSYSITQEEARSWAAVPSLTITDEKFSKD